jgi:hypothetical protein
MNARMPMMERVNDDLRKNDHGERDEADEDKQSYDFPRTRPLNEMQRPEGQVVSGIARRLHGVDWFGQEASSSLGSINPFFDIANNTVSEAISMTAISRGGIGPNARPLSNPYQQSPFDITRMNTTALRNTSPPLRYSADTRVVPSSTGIIRLDQNYMLFPTTKVIARRGGANKTTRNETELDMNLPFPVKLHYILSNPKYQEFIAWLPHGRSWRIRNPETFEKEVIPKIFRSSKIASFMRQVSCSYC